jgi:hypothetical protein
MGENMVIKANGGFFKESPYHDFLMLLGLNPMLLMLKFISQTF